LQAACWCRWTTDAVVVATAVIVASTGMTVVATMSTSMSTTAIVAMIVDTIEMKAEGILGLP
jgi:hypothetical protein